MANLPPWHLWGGTIAVHLVASAAPFELIQPQVCRIAYGRPDTWTFLFWTKVMNSPNAGGGAAGVVQVRWNLTIGIGRSSITINDFVLFLLSPLLPTVGTQLYTTTATDSENRILSDFPAQDVQLNANCIITGGAAPGSIVDLEIGAFLAPKNHVRPEWFRREFAGNEDHGQ
jgi:hypothetical protein